MSLDKNKNFDLDTEHEKLFTLLETSYRGHFEAYKIAEAVRNQLSDIYKMGYESGFNKAININLDEIDETKKD